MQTMRRSTLHIAFLACLALKGSIAVRVGDTDAQIDRLSGLPWKDDSEKGTILQSVINAVQEKDPVGLADKGVTVQPFECADGSSINANQIVLACNTSTIEVVNPEPPAGYRRFAAPSLLYIKNVEFQITCNTGAIMSFVGHLSRTKALSFMGQFGKDRITGYEGPPLCRVDRVDILQPTVSYETGKLLPKGTEVEDADPSAPPLRKILTEKGFETSNVNQLARLFLPGEDPDGDGDEVGGEAEPALVDKEPVIWNEAQFSLNQMVMSLNGHKMNYNRDVNKALNMLIGSKAKGMMKLVLAIGKLVRNIAYDTMKHLVASKTTKLASSVKGGMNRTVSMMKRMLAAA